MRDDRDPIAPARCGRGSRTGEPSGRTRPDGSSRSIRRTGTDRGVEARRVPPGRPHRRQVRRRTAHRRGGPRHRRGGASRAPRSGRRHQDAAAQRPREQGRRRALPPRGAAGSEDPLRARRARLRRGHHARRHAVHGDGVPRGHQSRRASSTRAVRCRSTGPSTTCCRRARPWPRRTSRASSTATSSPTTCSSPRGAAASPSSRSSTSASRRCRRPTRASPAAS